MTAQMPINVFLKASETGDSDDQKKREREEFVEDPKRKKRIYANKGRKYRNETEYFDYY